MKMRLVGVNLKGDTIAFKVAVPTTLSQFVALWGRPPTKDERKRLALK